MTFIQFPGFLRVCFNKSDYMILPQWQKRLLCALQMGAYFNEAEQIFDFSHDNWTLYKDVVAFSDRPHALTFSVN